MAITQFIHTNDNHSTAKSVHLGIDSSFATTATATATTEDNYYNEHPGTLTALSTYSTTTTITTATSLPKPSDSLQISVSGDASSTCMEQDTLEPTFLNNAAVVQNDVNDGSDRAKSVTSSYEKRTCFSSSNKAYEKRDVEDKETMAAIHALARTSLTDELDGDEQYIRRRRAYHLDDKYIGKPRSRPHSRSTSPHRSYTKSAATLARHSRSKLNQTRWQQLVIQAGSAAGTTVAIMSEESMKCLRYCLYWLQYATQHIQQQMHLLRLFLVSLVSSSSTVSPSNQQQPSVSLSSIQTEIILTLRKVVDVVSQYAGVGLPTHAKATVRSFILQLPGKWATLNTNTNSNEITTTDDEPDVPEHDGCAKETSAIKLLKFGAQSIEMLDSVSSVFSDSIDRAHIWLDRLRLIGVVPPRPMEN
ncbi:unnamed protein product [Absidia cylindrospora]